MNKQKELIEKEIKGCFDYFWNNSKENGLTLDKTTSNLDSIAATGFSLAAYVIGTERGFITFSKGYERALLCLKTVLSLPNKEGFLPHFIKHNTMENSKSEFSTIDTSILLMGAITASSFFGNEVKIKTDYLIERINWDFLITKKNQKKQVIMAYSDYYWKDNNGFCKATWDHYAEQLMIYLLYASKKDTTKEDALNLYNGFNRNVGKYKGDSLIYCFSNPLFIHQFTHCFFDFRKYLDCNNIDWFKNSTDATIANRQFCIDQTWSKTYNSHSWGLTAFQGKEGYKVYGAPPYGFENNPYTQTLDGSVAPYASLSSIVFTPKESIEALEYFNTIDGLNKQYGLTDSYNFEKERFVSDVYLGIDKGPTIIMLDNYLKGTTWKYFMESEYAKIAIEKLDFKLKN